MLRNLHLPAARPRTLLDVTRIIEPETDDVLRRPADRRMPAHDIRRVSRRRGHVAGHSPIDTGRQPFPRVMAVADEVGKRARKRTTWRAEQDLYVVDQIGLYAQDCTKAFVRVGF